MLARLLLSSDSWATSAELRQASGMSQASLHRELTRAVDAGLIERDGARQPHRFRAVTSHPAFAPLSALVKLTVGVEDELRSILEATEGVEAAAIYGSFARGTQHGDSDVDLMVIGSGVDSARLRSRLRELGDQLGRQIDLMLATPAEFSRLLADENPFLRLVLERPLVPLIGDVAELAR